MAHVLALVYPSSMVRVEPSFPLIRPFSVAGMWPETWRMLPMRTNET